MAIHVIQCPHAGAALKLSLILEHEGYPSVWHVRDGKPIVTTFAPLSAVKACVASCTNAA